MITDKSRQLFKARRADYEVRIRAGARWRPFQQERPLPPRLTFLASFIAHRWPALRVELRDWTTSTDRKAGRIRVPGKGREGKMLTVYDPSLDPHGYSCRASILLQHESGVPYSFNSDVCAWIVKRLESRT